MTQTRGRRGSVSEGVGRRRLYAAASVRVHLVWQEDILRYVGAAGVVIARVKVLYYADEGARAESKGWSFMSFGAAGVTG